MSEILSIIFFQLPQAISPLSYNKQEKDGSVNKIWDDRLVKKTKKSASVTFTSHQRTLTVTGNNVVVEVVNDFSTPQLWSYRGETVPTKCKILRGKHGFSLFHSLHPGQTPSLLAPPTWWKETRSKMTLPLLVYWKSSTASPPGGSFEDGKRVSSRRLRTIWKRKDACKCEPPTENFARFCRNTLCL